MLLSPLSINLLCFLVSFVSTQPTAAPSSRFNPNLILPSLPPSNHTPAPLTLLNETTKANASTTNLTTPAFYCDPHSYGVGLNLSSCQNALAKIGHGTAPLIFGMRGAHGQPDGHWNVVMPLRILSGESEFSWVTFTTQYGPMKILRIMS